MNGKYTQNNLYKKNSIIEDKHYLEAEHIIEKINYRRLKLVGLVSSLMEVVLLFILPKFLVMNFDITFGIFYNILHNLILAWGIIVFIVSSQFYKNQSKKIFEYFCPLAAFIFMILIMFVGILDQYTLGKTTSYITFLFALGITLFIKSPLNYFVFGIPHFIFVSILFTKFPLDNHITSTIINSSTFLISILIISKVFYKTQYSQILSNLILEETNEKMSKIIYTDNLTSLPNRRWFEETIRSYKPTGVLAIMDLDFFKRVNDEFGHHIGDLVLKETALVIKNSLEDFAFVARWGGEEFIFFFPDSSLSDSVTKLNTLKNNISSNIIKSENIEINVTASFGATEFLTCTEVEYINAFRLADRALYKAKNCGRNVVITISNQGKED